VTPCCQRALQGKSPILPHAYKNLWKGRKRSCLFSTACQDPYTRDTRLAQVPYTFRTPHRTSHTTHPPERTRPSRKTRHTSLSEAQDEEGNRKDTCRILVQYTTHNRRDTFRIPHSPRWRRSRRDIALPGRIYQSRGWRIRFSRRRMPGIDRLHFQKNKKGSLRPLDMVCKRV